MIMVSTSARDRVGDDNGEGHYHYDSSSVQNSKECAYMFNFLHYIRGSFSMEGLPQYWRIVCFRRTRPSFLDPDPSKFPKFVEEVACEAFLRSK